MRCPSRVARDIVTLDRRTNSPNSDTCTFTAGLNFGAGVDVTICTTQYAKIAGWLNSRTAS